MNNEEANKPNENGIKDNQTLPISNEPLSIVDEAKKVRDDIRKENDRREKILKEEQKLKANNLLGGSSGGHIETKSISPEQQKKEGAKEFFKGTNLEKAIDEL